jgi:hypothetical protein
MVWRKIHHLHLAINNASGNIVGAYFDTQETLKGYYHVLQTRYSIGFFLPIFGAYFVSLSTAENTSKRYQEKEKVKQRKTLLDPNLLSK